MPLPVFNLCMLRDGECRPVSLSAGGKNNLSSFDHLHSAIASKAYHEAIRATSPDLPDWLTPASVLNTADLNTILAGLNVVEDQTIIDLGCGAGGPGLWVAEQTGASLVGIDGSDAAVTIATALAESRGMSHRARFRVADFVATKLPDECADGVMCLDALMFVDPRLAALEIRRLAKRGAHVVIRSVESLIDPFTPTLVRDYRPIFEAAGITVLRYDEVADYRDRSLRYFRAIEERAGAMYAEIGSAANILINEARDSLEMAKKSPRVRTVFLVAQA